MDIVCPGWGVPPSHAPKVIGWKDGEGDERPSHGICGACRVDMKALERVRITALIYERVISYVTDRLGAALRLKMAKKLPGFKGHSVQAVP